MDEKTSESPFVEEMGGNETPTAPAAEPGLSALPETPPATEPEDKTIRLEAEISYLRDRVADSEAAVAAFKRQTSALILVGFLLTGLCGFLVLQLKGRNAKQTEDLKAMADQVAGLKTGSSAPVLTAPDRSPHVFTVTFSHWEQGQPPVKLIRRSEGFCVLSKITGHFEGGGESVRLWIDSDGFWYLGGDSHQQGIAAECAVMRY